MPLDDLELQVVRSLHEGGPHTVRAARWRYYLHAFGSKLSHRLIQVIDADGHVVDDTTTVRRVSRASLPLPTVECFCVRRRIPEERDVIELR